jgi:hypothetical protein
MGERSGESIDMLVENSSKGEMSERAREFVYFLVKTILKSKMGGRRGDTFF